MSHLPIARKYRPQTFIDVIGQDVVVKTLGNAIALNRLHHAYLFCGIRGVGKTSLARILAKSLNCEKGPTLEPCGTCDACREISQGISLDVLEIDGASNTGVDDIRELKEQTAYLPQRGRYKIFIIDEVHMLSNSAFNALLKVLEEPPPHVIFCFATTELHKIPLTVLSRCQKFDLRRIPLNEIVAHLKTICAAEGVSYDDVCLNRIARLGEGSLRDSLSLLDQAIGLAESKLTRDRLDDWLGLSHRELVYALLQAMVSQDHRAVLASLARLKTVSIDPERFLIEFLEMLRHLMMVQAGASNPELPELSSDEHAALAQWGKLISPHVLDWMFQMAMHGLQDLAQTPLPFYTLEILMLRLLRARELRALATLQEPEKETPRAEGKKTEPKKSEGDPDKTWRGFVAWLREKEPNLGSVLSYVQWRISGETAIELSAERESIYLDMLVPKKDRLEDLASQFFQRKMTVAIGRGAPAPQPERGTSPLAAGGLQESVITAEKKETARRQEHAETEARSNPMVQKLTEIFGATLEAVKPIKK